jgi:hypothetical protein
VTVAVAAAHEPATPHEAAHAYRLLGWRVIPIAPGSKHPAGIGRWQDVATTDPNVIDAWWTGLYNGHGVGIVTGPDTGLFVLDVDVADGKHGDDTIHQLEQTHGELPDTVEAITGRGGRHLYFAWPTGGDVRTNAARLGPGLDVRAAGGQVLAPPTIGPTGGAYSWVDGHEPWHLQPAHAPGWLLELLAGEPTPEAATGDPSRGPDTYLTPGVDDGPAARFNAATRWSELLERDGWTLHHTDRDGEQHWTRPGKDRREGTSATVGYKGNDALKVFTSSVAGLDADKAYSRFGYYAATRHGGDRSACARALIGAGYGTTPTSGPALEPWTPSGGVAPPVDAPPATPLAIRWTDELAGNMPPEPPELIEGFLRAGEMAAVGAPRAIGKTWFGYNLAVRLADGTGQFLGNLDVKRTARVLYLQGELDEWGSATRWQILTGTRLTPPRVAETFDRIRFRVVRRRITRTVAGQTVTDEHLDADIDGRLEQAIVDHNIDVVIVDPWAVFLAAAENSNDEVEAVLGALREITLRTGVAWVIIHHITGKAERSSWTEPEDLWRGATRLADWASTRVTVLPHYTDAVAKEKGLNRREARRHVDVHFLRRSTPTDGFSARLDNGWWTAWTPDDIETSPTLELARKLADDGGTWDSYRQAAAALGVHKNTAIDRIAAAERAGLVTLAEGTRGSTVITLDDTVEHPWSSRRAAPTTGQRLGNAQSDPDSAHWMPTAESVPDQGKRHSDAEPVGTHWADPVPSAKPLVNDTFQRLGRTPSPYGGGPLDGPPPPGREPDQPHFADPAPLAPGDDPWHDY